MVGWYDEFNGVIPWYLNIIKFNGYDFFHLYAGGVSSKQTYLEGNEALSLIKIIFEHLDSWAANFLFRVLGYTLGIFSLYYFIRKTANLPETQALCLSMAGFAINFIPYGWMLASMGYGFFGIIVFCYYYFYINKFNIVNTIIPLLCFILVSATTPPVFLYAQLGYFCLAFSIISQKNLHPNNSYRGFLIFSLLLFETSNWILGLYYSTIQTQNFTSRMIDPMAIFNGLNALDMLLKISHEQLLELIKFIKREPHYLLLLLYLLTFFLLIFTKRYLLFLKLILILFLLPLFFEIISKLLKIPLLKQFQFHTLWEVHSLILVLIIANTMKDISLAWFKRSIYLSVLVSSFGAFWMMTAVTLENLNLYGGGGVFFHYQSLANLNTKGDLGRVISNAYLNPTVPNFYGIDTFDGVPHIAAKLRVDYDAFSLKNNSTPKSTVNHAWRIYPTFPEGYNIDLFSMANVTHLVSKAPVNDDRFSLVEFQSGRTSHDYLFFSLFRKISLVPDIYIYKLKQKPWPIVFTPTRIYPYNSLDYDFKYFDQLKNLKFGEILVLNSDNFQNKDMETSFKSLPYIRTKKGYEISNINNSKFVVINTVFTPYWKGMCDGNNVELSPANGIMILAKIPEKCHTLELTYDTSY